MYGVAYLRSAGAGWGRLWLPVGLHFGWNWVQGTVLGFPVSGTTDFSGAFTDLAASGPTWLSGGAYGPEGSVFSLVGRLAIIALVVAATRQSSSWPGQLGHRLAAHPEPSVAVDDQPAGDQAGRHLGHPGGGAPGEPPALGE